MEQTDEHLEPGEQEKNGNRDHVEHCGHHHEHHLAAKDISPESRGERQDPDDLSEELDEANEYQQPSQEGTLLERFEIQPALEVAPTERSNALCLIANEGDDGETERDVVVGCGRMQQRDLPDEGHHAQPV